MKKYLPIEAGQRVKIPWRTADYKMACCDCGADDEDGGHYISPRLELKELRTCSTPGKSNG